MSNYPFLPFGKPVSVRRGEGAYLVMDDGRRILDAAGGAIVTNIGHGRAEVGNAVAKATEEEGYVVPPWHTPSRVRLIERLVADWLPPHLTRIHLTCGGSEGVESAMKIAIQHFAAVGRPEKRKVVGRSISYHGTTLATTAVGGHAARKKGLLPALQDYPSTPTPYPLRCPGNDPVGYYLEAFEDTVETEGPDTIAAFVGEPIVGASGGAIVPPDGYWEGIREICDRHEILLIADEVMTGFGRTGTTFGYQHWPFAPDLLVAGKGLAGGYAPLTGVFATEAIAAPIAESDINVMFHTFAAHPAACAAADKVLEIM
ncbi:MAG: aspartate aminotransferase family protein, partial [Gammaproteobacteria bacterium]|nr:aspartate aminotransferase family protein [Gammaproteobacteria bacterium]